MNIAAYSPRKAGNHKESAELNNYFRGLVLFWRRNLANATANFIPKPIKKFLINPLMACIGHVTGLCQQNFVIYVLGKFIIFERKRVIRSILGDLSAGGACGFED